MAERTYSVPHRRLRLLASLLDTAADLADLCLADAPCEADERHAAHIDHAVRAVSYIATQIAASVNCHIPCSSLDLPGSTFGDDLRALAREASAIDEQDCPESPRTADRTAVDPDAVTVTAGSATASGSAVDAEGPPAKGPGDDTDAAAVAPAPRVPPAPPPAAPASSPLAPPPCPVCFQSPARQMIYRPTGTTHPCPRCRAADWTRPIPTELTDLAHPDLLALRAVFSAARVLRHAAERYLDGLADDRAFRLGDAAAVERGVRTAAGVCEMFDGYVSCMAENWGCLAQLEDEDAADDVAFLGVMLAAEDADAADGNEDGDAAETANQANG